MPRRPLLMTCPVLVLVSPTGLMGTEHAVNCVPTYLSSTYDDRSHELELNYQSVWNTCLYPSIARYGHEAYPRYKVLKGPHACWPKEVGILMSHR